MSTVAQRLSRAVVEQKISLVELAERAKISRSSVQRYASDATRDIPAGKLAKLSEVLELPNDYLLGIKAFSNWDDIDRDRSGFLQRIRDQMDPDAFNDIVNCIYSVDTMNPYQTPLTDFTSFVNEFVISASKSEGRWDVKLKDDWLPEGRKSSDFITDDQIKAAFFNGADPTLTKEEQDAMWDEAKAFIDFKIQQRKRKENQ